MLNLSSGRTIFSGIAGDPPPDPRSNQRRGAIFDKLRGLQRLDEQPIERAVRESCERQGRQIYRAVPVAEEPEVVLEMPHLGEIQAETS